MPRISEAAIALTALVIIAVIAGKTMSDPKDVLVAIAAGIVGWLSNSGDHNGTSG